MPSRDAPAPTIPTPPRQDKPLPSPYPVLSTRRPRIWPETTASLTLGRDGTPRCVVHIHPWIGHDYAAFRDACTDVRPVALNDNPDNVCPRSFRNEYGDTRRFTSCT